MSVKTKKNIMNNEGKENVNEHTSRRSPLTPTENLAVGAFGGALETSLQMPILTYKFCLQEGRQLPKSVSGWYRGVGVQAGTVAPITALQFMVNGMLQNLILKVNSSGPSSRDCLTEAERMLSAAGAGAISALVYSPVDLITVQQQKMEANPIATFRTIIQNYGITRGIFRGFSACACREAVYTCGYLGLAPVLTARLVDPNEGSTFLKERPLLAAITGACLAGTTAAIITHPIDTAKTCVQSDMTATTWPTSRVAALKLYGEGGIASLFRGMIPRTVRLCGAFFVCLMVQDSAIQYKTAYETG